MTLHTWLLFVAAVFLLSGTPGPNMLHIMSRSVELGLKRSVAAMAGCLVAIVILVVTFAAVETFWYGVYALTGRSLSRYMGRPAIRRAFDRVTGVIFIGFGLALLKARPA